MTNKTGLPPVVSYSHALATSKLAMPNPQTATELISLVPFSGSGDRDGKLPYDNCMAHGVTLPTISMTVPNSPVTAILTPNRDSSLSKAAA